MIKMANANDADDIIPQQVISKLGHEIEEIRRRALESVLSKLSHGIINVAQASNCRELCIHLLEWFNFKTVPMKREALSLLLQLAREPCAAGILNAVGTVDFLISLRKDLDTSYYGVIDELLEALFMVPYQAEDCEMTNVNDAHKLQVPAIAEIKDKEQDLNLYSLGHYVGFNFLTLPWIELSGTDWHVLSSTYSSLTCDDVQVVLNSCNFLNDVVFQDFSPEIFLQRPMILRSLLQLVETGQNECKLAALDCISSVISALVTRMTCVLDAGMYSVDRDDNIMPRLGRPVAIGQSDVRLSGDGQDGDSTSANRNFARNQTSRDADSVEQDQDNTIIQFALSVLSGTSSLLKSLNIEILIKATRLSNSITDLVKVCINKKIWYDPSAIAKSVTVQLLNNFKELASVILHHYSNCFTSLPMDEISLRKQAMACVAVVWSKLLEAVTNLEDIAVIGFPEECLESISMMIMDPAILHAFPKMHSYLTSVAELAIPDVHAAFCNSQRVCDSLMAAAKFVNQNDEISIVEQLRLADAAVVSLNCQPPDLFLNKFVHWISITFCFGSPCNDNLGEACKVFLKILAHAEDNIKLSMYRLCANLTKEIINVDQAVDAKLAAATRLFVVIQLEVLEEICCFGVTNENLQVADFARDILLHLIKGQFLMNEEMWNILTSNLRELLSLLSAHVDCHTSLGQALFQMLDTDNTWLSSVDLLRSNLRALFSTDHRLRRNTVPRIAWFLSKSENALYKLPTLQKLDTSELSDLFIGGPARLFETCERKGSDLIGELMAIVEEATEFSALFLSALKQLVFLSEDLMLQDQFVREKFHLKMVDCVSTLLTADIDGCEKYPFHIIVDVVPACANIILNMSLLNKFVVPELCEDPDIYHMLLRACLLLPSQKALHQDVACLLALMLFNEIANVEHKRVGKSVQASIGVPAVVCQRFKFPLIVFCEHLRSPHSAPPVKIKVNEKFEVLVESAKRIHWNFPLYKDKDDMCCRAIFNKDECLSLQAADILNFKAINPVIVKESVRVIQTATSHDIVLHNLKTILIHFYASSQWENTHPLESEDLQCVISRFLAMKPNSTADRELLKQILQFIHLLMCNSMSDIWKRNNTIVNWMWRMASIKDGAIQYILTSAGLETYSPLHKELLMFMSTLLRVTPEHFSKENVKGFEIILASQMQFVLLNLNIAAAPQFYNLVSLEAALNCLVHISARTSWSDPLVKVFNFTLHQLVGSLIEVVAAFSVGQIGPTCNSFMGRAVTVASTLSLSHIAAELRSSPDEEWVNSWFVHVDESRQNDAGLSWLLPLWSHWDPEVRIASVCVAVSLTTTKNGCIALATQLNRYNGGIWELLMGFLFDPREPCLVREQVALLMTNLTSNVMTFESELIIASWESPTLTWIDALLEVLHFSNFYQNVVQFLSNLYLPARLRQKIVGNAATQSCSEVPAQDDRNRRSLNNAVSGTMTDSRRNSPAFSEMSTASVSTSSGENRPKSMIATPALIAGLVQFMRNILVHFPSDTIQNIKNMRIVNYIFRCFNEAMAAWTKERKSFKYSLNNYEILLMVTNMLDLLDDLCQIDTEVCGLVAASSNNLSQFYNLLSAKFYEMQIHAVVILKLWGSCYKLLTTILQVRNPISIPQFRKTLHLNINVIAANVEHVLTEDSKAGRYYCGHGLRFLEQLFEGEARQIQEKFDIKMQNDEDSLRNLFDCDRKVPTWGSNFCNVLLKKISGIPWSLNSKADLSSVQEIIGALQMLLAFSMSAKEKALQDGLLDIILKRFNMITIRSTGCSENLPKKQINSKNNLVKDFELHADLLKNFMCGSVAVKTVASNSDLVKILAKLWPWLEEQGKSILRTVLTLLCTFVAHCQSACRTIGLYNSGATEKTKKTKSKFESQATCGFSFVNAAICICEKETRNFSSNDSLLEVAFDLLCTLSLVPVCREIISKSVFVQNIPQISGKNKKESELKRVLTVHWLRLCVNMSFSEEGQEIILNMRDGLDLLLEVGAGPQSETKQMALLVVRNLCFHPTGKAKALCTDNFIATISRIAMHEKSRSQYLAISAIWALVCNNQKVKVAVKNSRFIHQLEGLLNECADDTDKLRTSDIIKNVIAMLR